MVASCTWMQKRFSPLTGLVYRMLYRKCQHKATRCGKIKPLGQRGKRWIMTVLLVLVMFAIFLTIDYFYSKAKHPVLQVAPAMRKGEATAPRLQPSLVGGFAVPDNLRYHPGHTWALSESPTLVRIGIDDFASKLTGKIEHVKLPQRGQGSARDRRFGAWFATA